MEWRIKVDTAGRVPLGFVMTRTLAVKAVLEEGSGRETRLSSPPCMMRREK